MTRWLIRILTIFALQGVLFAAIGHAQAWPAKPVRILVGAAPGSAPDVVLRLLGQKLSQRIGQPVVVENRAGAGGIPGTVAAAHAPADGYNFLFGLGSALAMNQFLHRTLPYDPEKDFVPVIGLGVTPMVIAVNSQVPVKDLQELLSLAASRPGGVRTGTTSKSAAHLTMAALARQADVEFLHVFYRSAPDALRDTLGSQVDVFSDALAALPTMSNPRLRVLAVTSPSRLKAYPQIPTAAETLPGFVAYGWYALMAPAGVPQDVIAAMNRELNTVLKEPEVVSRLAELVTLDAGGSPDDLARFIRKERDRLRLAAQAAKIQPE